jgi:hypothetical protein
VFSGETEKSGAGVPLRTHWANHNDSPRSAGENRIVRKYMAELGILREEGVNVRRALALTSGDWAFGEK